MSGIYIHIPFCKQACHYCDFHFSTSMKKKEEIVLALAKELSLRKSESDGEIIETIYFGGGTPSVLSNQEIGFLLDTVYLHYQVSNNPEITLEANPDDLSPDRIVVLAQTKINRLSIGIQSFFDEDLKMMNRAHNATEARQSLHEAVANFDNISVDLIYGIPGMSDARWRQNIEEVLSLEIPHISAYALTVEPRTALKKMIETKQIAAPSDKVAQRHFRILTEILAANGFIHYELSNFGKQGFFSRNNSGYWTGEKYIGIGPSSHSFNGVTRSWNIANNAVFIRSILEDKLPSEVETLTLTDRYNEYIMTGLRTIWGVSLTRIKDAYGVSYYEYLLQNAQRFLADELLVIDDNVLMTTSKGKFLTDGIASDLFLVNLAD